MIKATKELDYSRDHIHLNELDMSEDKVEWANVTTKDVKENRINMSPITWWWKPCMRVIVSLFINQGKLLRKHRNVKAISWKGWESDESKEAKVLIMIEVDLEECHDAIDADLPIVKKGMQMRDDKL